MSNRDTRYGYHVPRRDARDNYYKKLEEERAARVGA
jgi:cytochrome c oxidase subunit 7